MKKLSHSACSKWMTCPASFDYYYNQKIRPTKMGSALMFGSAMDAALNALLLPAAEQPLFAYQAVIESYPLGSIGYGKYDYDPELLTAQNIPHLLVQLRAVGYKGDDVTELFTSLQTKLFNREDISVNQAAAIDLIYRAVFKAKAELMIEAYKTKVLPEISEVYNVQKRSGPGYLDATVNWKGRGKVVLDNKTSSRPYADNAVEFSAQLAMYSAEEKINQVAFVVLVKEINKNRRKVCKVCGHIGKGSHKTCDYMDGKERCNGEWTMTISPEADIQIVHGEVTPEMQAVAAELQREVQRAVDAKIFPCNVGQCNNQYGRPCEYRDLKWKGSMDNLEHFGKGTK